MSHNSNFLCEKYHLIITLLQFSFDTAAVDAISNNLENLLLTKSRAQRLKNYRTLFCK